jgi:hypothetical protein
MTLLPVDDYADDSGAPVRCEWLPDREGVDVTLYVHLSGAPSSDATAALERAVAAWYKAGLEGEFSVGVLHDLRGPYWDGPVAWWAVDLGSADDEEAIGNLARRLGGWSASWGCAIKMIRVGRVRAP